MTLAHPDVRTDCSVLVLGKEARRTWDSVGGTLLVLTIVYLAFMLVGSVRRRFNEPDTDKLDDDGTTDTPGGETAPDNAV